jgi:hypothetical protein
VRVLSIDGGGIRGIIPALVLAEIERRTGRPVHELFNLVAGTSTGGILALALTQEGGPRSATDIVELYEQDGPRIFSRSVGRRVRSAEGVLDEKYSADALEEALARRLGEARLSGALADVLVTAYDTQAREPFFFKSTRARERPDRDAPIRLAARATAAAPTYFQPLELRIEGKLRSLVDGGVFANNPAMSAYAEARREGGGSDMFLLSLGTGEQIRPLPYDDVRDWGLLRWARPILDVVFDGQSDAVDYQLRHLLGDARYVRLQTSLTDANDDLDDASPRNLAALRRHGEALIEQSGAAIDRVLARLGA